MVTTLPSAPAHSIHTRTSGHSPAEEQDGTTYVDFVHSVFLRIVQLLVAATEDTIPDDFYHLYPEDVPDNVKDLATTGIGFGPLIIGAVLIVVIGGAMIGRRRQNR